MTPPQDWQGANWQIVHGDSRYILSKYVEDSSVDALVTDPPYGLSSASPEEIADMLSAWAADGAYVPKRKRKGFQSREWDATVPQPALWKEVFRAMKPGAHGLVFAGSRTIDLMGVSLRLAGFEVKDTLLWLYASSVPASLNISKAIDKAAGATRKKVRIPARSENAGWTKGKVDRPWLRKAREQGYHEVDDDTPITDEARTFNGYGTALKPAMEPILLIRKPPEGTIVNNVLTWGTGGLDIAGCGMPSDPFGRGAGKPHAPVVVKVEDNTKFPTNVLHDGSDELMAVFEERAPGRGTAVARFYFSPKANKHDRDAATAANDHPTVKPVALMEYLVRLVSPPEGGLVLDPFCGSGSTGKGLLAIGRDGLEFLGIDQSADYCEIAARRLSL